MAEMIKLRLGEGPKNFASVQALPGLRGLTLDPGFGLVCLDPDGNLYAVLAEHVDDLQPRRQQSPEILEAYGDQQISAI